MRKLTLYIIDDEPEVINALTELFRPNKRYSVRGYSCAAEVRDALEHHPPHLAICDYLMPECDGLELLRELKGRLPRLRSLLLTGEPFSPEIISGMEEGIFELYVAKPYNARELEETLARLAREVAKDL